MTMTIQQYRFQRLMQGHEGDTMSDHDFAEFKKAAALDEIIRNANMKRIRRGRIKHKRRR